MSCGKYHIMWASYPYQGCYDGDCGTNSFIVFVVKFAVACLRYEIVDVEFRNHKRMDRNAVD